MGDALILVEATRDCKKSPRGVRAPTLRSPSEGPPGCGPDHSKAPRSCAALRPPEGFLKTPFRGAVASREPPEPPPCRLHRGSHGGGPGHYDSTKNN